MPLLGFGVYQNYTTQESVLEALRAGYRWARLSETLLSNPSAVDWPVTIAVQAC